MYYFVQINIYDSQTQTLITTLSADTPGDVGMLYAYQVLPAITLPHQECVCVFTYILRNQLV